MVGLAGGRVVGTPAVGLAGGRVVGFIPDVGVRTVGNPEGVRVVGLRVGVVLVGE